MQILQVSFKRPTHLVALNYKQEVLKTNILVICLESQQNETNISDL